MKKYTCVLFDLDHTLWDFETNSKEALRELFSRYKFHEREFSFNFFFETFTRVNLELWALYDKNLIGPDVIRTERFHRVFVDIGIEDHPLSLKFSEDFLTELPKGNSLLPFTIETLDYLYTRYPMVIVTNGFDEIQSKKMASGKISHYFKNVITSQRAGGKKPSRKIFDFALHELGQLHENAIMIGDNLLTDIGGARSAGIDTVYFNPLAVPHTEKVTFEIKSLDELRTLL